MPFIFVALVAAAATARASASPDRVAIARFRGVHAQQIQGVLENSLLKRFYLVPDFTVEETARRQGVGLVADRDFAQVGRALRVRGFVSALVRKGRDWQVQLLVRRGDTGRLVGRFLVTDRRLDRLEWTLATRAPRRLLALFADMAAATAAATAAIEAPAPEVIEAEEAPAPPRRRAAASAASADVATASADATATATATEEGPARREADVLTLRLGGRVFNRTFTYSQNLSGLPDYHVGGAFVGVAEATFHPFPASSGLAPLGVAGSLEYGLGVSSGYADTQNRADSQIHAYSLAARWRIIGGQFTFAPEVGYAVQTFVTGAPGGTAPDVNYGLATGGFDARWSPNQRISVLARAAYLHVLSAGPLVAADRFSHATVRGVTAEAGLSVALAASFELHASAGIRQFGFAMNSQPDDKQVAGGAVDQTTWLALGLSYGRNTSTP